MPALITAPSVPAPVDRLAIEVVAIRGGEASPSSTSSSWMYGQCFADD